MNINNLINLYNSGRSYESIAKEIGMSKGWVRKSLNGKVISRPASIKKQTIYKTIEWNTTKERDRLTIELYQSGDGTATIAKKLKIAKKTASRILNEKNVIDKNRKPGRMRAFAEKINELYNSGLSSSQIASKLSCSSTTIDRYIHAPRKSAEALYQIPKDIQERILHLYTIDKLSSYQIAAEFGYNYQRVQNFLRRQKVSVGSLTPEWRAAVQRGIKSGGSSLEKAVEQILNELGLQYRPQYELDEFRYDFGIVNGSILIEVQGSYWHSLKTRINRDIYKRNLAAKNGKKLLVIWDYELSKPDIVKSRILNAVSPVEFDFTKLEIRKAEWEQSKILLNKFHYQGCGRAGIAIGAYSGCELVAVATFCRPTRQETAQKQHLDYSEVLELVRFVINPSYQSRNFASWFLARTIRIIAKNKCKRLIAFADPTFGHIGTIYKSTNWKFDGISEASYWYYHRRSNSIAHKKTVWNAAKRLGLSEEEYAKKKNYLKVHGQPKMRYILNL
jgi:very-short-patch-repair endonuclease